MPDLTVMDGGGEARDRDREIAQQYFEDFVLALLRGLAGSNQTYHATQHCLDFVEHAEKTQVPISAVIDGAIKQHRQSAFDIDNASDYKYDRIAVIEAALRVAIESMATDNAAKGRLAKPKAISGASSSRWS
ncbi:hypothetical protein [Rhizobium johnstonii]|uniref:hypothetical protein n=1 Tax=Rhizobium johnstonii TaxID=3019933 RepID=UPI003F9DC4A4